MRAAKGGEVLYAGSDMKEYGNMVLVRHEDGSATAYGQLEDIDVKQGTPSSKVGRWQRWRQPKGIVWGAYILSFASPKMAVTGRRRPLIHYPIWRIRA